MPEHDNSLEPPYRPPSETGMNISLPRQRSLHKIRANIVYIHTSYIRISVIFCLYRKPQMQTIAKHRRPNRSCTFRRRSTSCMVRMSTSETHALNCIQQAEAGFWSETSEPTTTKRWPAQHHAPNILYVNTKHSRRTATEPNCLGRYPDQPLKPNDKTTTTTTTTATTTTTHLTHIG